MKHRTLTITERQNEWLEAQSSRSQVSDSEYLRRVLDEKIDGTSQATRPVAHDDAVADKGSAKMIRVRTTSRDRLNEIAQVTGISQIDIVSRLLDLSMEQLIAIVTGGEVELPTMELGKRERVPLPVGDDLTTIDYFISEHCVTARDLSVPIQAVYSSYVEYMGLGATVEPLEDFIRYVEENCSVNIVQVNRPAGLFARLALRPNAYAVLVGDVTGVEATE